MVKTPTSITVILILILTIPLVTSITNDPNRPKYQFSDEVFKNLPPYPEDLPEIRELYATQKLTDYSRLPPEYYLQPEFYPGWFATANKTYNRDPRIHGKFGLGFYPSTASIYLNEDTTLNLTVLIHSSPGVECYQGIVLNVTTNPPNILKTEILKPKTIKLPIEYHLPPNKILMLLEPTYPYFNRNWSQKFVLKIIPIKTGTATISIKNEKCPGVVEDYFKDVYGNSYTSQGSWFAFQIPAFTAKVYINPTSNPAKKVTKTINPSYVFIGLAFIILLFLLLVWRKINGKNR